MSADSGERGSGEGTENDANAKALDDGHREHGRTLGKCASGAV